MTVSELIAELQKHPPDSRVVVRGYEAGVDDVAEAKDTMVLLNIHKEWYYGCHATLGDLSWRQRQQCEQQLVPAVWLRCVDKDYTDRDDEEELT